MTYEFLPHTADVKVRATGDSLEAAFINASAALKTAICGELEVRAVLTRRIEIRAGDREALLCRFLEEFLYLLDAESFVPAAVESLKIAENELDAVVSGDDAAGYSFANSVKAVTYNEMSVREESGGWVVEFVLDV